jgi:hypothetical protein
MILNSATKIEKKCFPRHLLSSRNKVYWSLPGERRTSFRLLSSYRFIEKKPPCGIVRVAVKKASWPSFCCRREQHFILDQDGKFNPTDYDIAAAFLSPGLRFCKFRRLRPAAKHRFRVS